MNPNQIGRLHSIRQPLQTTSPFPVSAIPGSENEADRQIEGRPDREAASVVVRWLERGRNAIPQYERDEKRAEWMYRKMEAFARRHGERLSVLRRNEVLDYLAELTRHGQTEWQVMQALDSICILLSFGCGRVNVRMSEVREIWLNRRAELARDVQVEIAVATDGDTRSAMDFVEGMERAVGSSESVCDVNTSDFELENSGGEGGEAPVARARAKIPRSPVANQRGHCIS